MVSPSPDPVALLTSLVAYRTDLVDGNERSLAERLAEELRARGADEVIVDDVPRVVGKPASYVYARFGRPHLLVNAHLDTVPPNANWHSDPFVPRIEGDRLHALGAADTKGAIAAILTALDVVRPRDTAILFSGDEESSGVVIRDFVAGPRRAGLERAIVCEPTNLRIGTRHRGFLRFETTVTGPGGHSSKADTVTAPLAVLARVAVSLDDWGRAKRTVGPPGFPGMCLNIAQLDGGIAFNVIPARARLVVSLRPPPGADSIAIAEELRAIVQAAAPDATIEFQPANPAFATTSAAAFEPLLGDIVSTPLDLAFWTEAALLVANGVDAVVVGPGDIAHAHAPNEWVSIAELLRARDLFRDVFAATARAT